VRPRGSRCGNATTEQGMQYVSLNSFFLENEKSYSLHLARRIWLPITSHHTENGNRKYIRVAHKEIKFITFALRGLDPVAEMPPMISKDLHHR
jgi:hypothetical protein